MLFIAALLGGSSGRQPTGEGGGGGATTVYVIELSTEAVRDWCEQVEARVLDDARSEEADVIVLRVDAQCELRPVWVEPQKWGAWGEYAGFWRGVNIVDSLQAGVAERWGEQPRIVAWVHHAEGPAAQIVLGLRERCFAPDSEVLWGAEPEEPEWRSPSLRARSIMLSRLTMQSGIELDLVDRLAGAAGGEDREEGTEPNPLGANEARAMGLSLGTAGTEQELLELLGIGGEARVVAARASEILATWGEGLIAAQERLETIGAAFDQAERHEREAPTDDPKRAARREQVRALEEFLAVLGPYACHFDPEGEFAAQVSVMIEQIRDVDGLGRHP